MSIEYCYNCDNRFDEFAYMGTVEIQRIRGNNYDVLVTEDHYECDLCTERSREVKTYRVHPGTNMNILYYDADGTSKRLIP